MIQLIRFTTIHFATNKDTRSKLSDFLPSQADPALAHGWIGRTFNPNSFHLPTPQLGAIRPPECNEVENLSQKPSIKTKVLKSSFSTGKCVYCL